MLIVEDSCEFVGTRFFFCFRFLEKKKKLKVGFLYCYLRCVTWVRMECG